MFGHLYAQDVEEVAAGDDLEVEDWLVEDFGDLLDELGWECLDINFMTDFLHG